MKPSLDHIVYATRDLDATVDALAKQLDVRPSPGGRHVGLGTHNALLSLGDDCYLEVIGPDPTQAAPAAGRPFGVDQLDAPRLVTWAVHTSDLDAQVAAARDAGFNPGVVIDMARDTPEGKRLEWRLTVRREPAGDGLVPFLIDWGATPSPATTSSRGCTLVGLRAQHPEPDPVRELLHAVGVELDLSQGPRAALEAVLDTPRGQVTLA